MLTIRQSQWSVLQTISAEAFVAAMIRHLRRYFPDELAATNDPDLMARIRAGIALARTFSLESHRDCCRFLNLSVAYGWDFTSRTDTQWMTAILTDPRITNPSARLERLLEMVLYRLDVASQNSALRAQFQPPPTAPWRDFPGGADDTFWDQALLIRQKGSGA
jgi:hypothetical protein